LRRTRRAIGTLGIGIWKVDGGFLRNSSRRVKTFRVPLIKPVESGRAKAIGEMRRSLDPIRKRDVRPEAASCRRQ
jgi:hypothetical protein